MKSEKLKQAEESLKKYHTCEFRDDDMDKEVSYCDCCYTPYPKKVISEMGFKHCPNCGARILEEK